VTDADISAGDAPASPPPQGASQGEPPAAQDARLAAAQDEAARMREEWLRAKAETENVRRRGQEDVAKAHRFGIEGFAAALLAVKDSLEAALAVENTSVESLKQGVDITARQLDAVFEKFALKAIAPSAGERFDPHRHQAISQVESPQEPGTVASVLQKGFLLHERVLRPALVTVAKAPMGES
jgi:molecular chaperone GrpE